MPVSDARIRKALGRGLDRLTSSGWNSRAAATTASNTPWSRAAPSRRTSASGSRSSRSSRTSLGRPSRSQAPVPTSIQCRPQLASCSASRSWSWLVSCSRAGAVGGRGRAPPPAGPCPARGRPRRAPRSTPPRRGRAGRRPRGSSVVTTLSNPRLIATTVGRRPIARAACPSRCASPPTTCTWVPTSARCSATCPPTSSATDWRRSQRQLVRHRLPRRAPPIARPLAARAGRPRGAAGGLHLDGRRAALWDYSRAAAGRAGELGEPYDVVAEQRHLLGAGRAVRAAGTGADGAPGAQRRAAPAGSPVEVEERSRARSARPWPCRSMGAAEVSIERGLVRGALRGRTAAVHLRQHPHRGLRPGARATSSAPSCSPCCPAGARSCWSATSTRRPTRSGCRPSSATPGSRPATRDGSGAATCCQARDLTNPESQLQRAHRLRLGARARRRVVRRPVATPSD